MKIPNIILRLLNIFRHWFNDLVPELKFAIYYAVEVVENIKYFLDSPIIDVVKDIIPGDLDDVIIDKIRIELPKILVKLRLVEDLVERNYDKTTLEGMRNIKMLDNDLKKVYYHNIAILLAQSISNNALQWKDGVYLTQYYYDKRPTKNGITA